ncbi:hypothetical protein F0145_23485 [Adhaeribacter rhizoryzae]|uniref:DUF1440 domain-containing protein n=1 Tax=Adhaeribacter rhizoryzae TaxID=2607907 RepID=A0A5M6CXJ9_9BACT|nr:hypothetical protein F0145_23485 [Adhaeribacter rhizoryzae]
MIPFRYFLLWLFLPLLGVLNGTFRIIYLTRYLPDLATHQVSTLTGIILFGGYIWYVNQRWPFDSGKQAILVGCTWLVLTILFEFGFGHYIFGQPWPALLHDYHILAGRVWLLVLFWITISPLIFYKIKEKNPPSRQPFLK